MNPRFKPILAALVTALFLPAAVAQSAKSGAKAVATVNGTAIAKSRADLLASNQLAQGAPDNERLRSQIREELIRREVISQEARKQGLDKKPEVVTQMGIARQVALIQAYIQDYLKAHPIGDDALRKQYEEIVARLGNKADLFAEPAEFVLHEVLLGEVEAGGSQCGGASGGSSTLRREAQRPRQSTAWLQLSSPLGTAPRRSGRQTCQRPPFPCGSLPPAPG